RPRSLDIRVLALPRGKDPDELIRSDPAAWEAAVEAALPIMDHIYAMAKEGKDPRNAAHRREVADEMLPHIAQLTNVVERAEWLQRIAGGDRALLDALWRQMSRPRSSRSSSGEPAVSAAPRPSGAGQREAFCLALLYASPGLRNLG